MEAELVWTVWRRILREDSLQTALLDGDRLEDMGAFGLSEAERAIALAYARTPDSTRWAIDTYRFRSVNVVVEALYVGAPFTSRLLERRGHELEKLARDYLVHVGWIDRGPHTCRTAAGTLRFIDQALSDDRDAELSDLIAFEVASLDLLQSLAGLHLSPPPPWPLSRSPMFVQTGRGIVVTTRFDLEPWLREPDDIGRVALSEKTCCFLRYVRSSYEEPALLALNPRARTVLERVARPCSLSDLEVEPDLADVDRERILSILRRFHEFGVVRPWAKEGDA